MSGKAEAARKCLRFTKWPTVTDGDHNQRSAASAVPAYGTSLPFFPAGYGGLTETSHWDAGHQKFSVTNL
jgi:hypothetical protein